MEVLQEWAILGILNSSFGLPHIKSLCYWIIVLINRNYISEDFHILIVKLLHIIKAQGQWGSFQKTFPIIILHIQASHTESASVACCLEYSLEAGVRVSWVFFFHVGTSTSVQLSKSSDILFWHKCLNISFREQQRYCSEKIMPGGSCFCLVCLQSYEKSWEPHSHSILVFWNLQSRLSAP